MNFNRILGYVKSCYRLCNEVAQFTGNTRFSVYKDYLSAFILHGCLIKQYRYGDFYKLGRLMRKNSFTQRRLERVIKECNLKSSCNILEQKHLFNQHFSQYIQRKWLYSKSMQYVEFAELFNLASLSSGYLVTKREGGQEGEGIEKISTSEVKMEQLFSRLKEEEVIIEECIEQHPGMQFGNNSVNTIRAITFIDSNAQIHILRAALRAGVGDAVVDNFSAGGILYDIDIATGIIDAPGVNFTQRNIIKHPDTNVIMVGYQIPLWGQVLQLLNSAPKLLPQCRFVGWDIAITEYGVTLIEGNHNPGLFAMESAGKSGCYGEYLSIAKGV